MTVLAGSCLVALGMFAGVLVLVSSGVLAEATERRSLERDALLPGPLLARRALPLAAAAVVAGIALIATQ